MAAWFSFKINKHKNINPNKNVNIFENREQSIPKQGNQQQQNIQNSKKKRIVWDENWSTQKQLSLRCMKKSNNSNNSWKSRCVFSCCCCCLCPFSVFCSSFSRSVGVLTVQSEANFIFVTVCVHLHIHIVIHGK